MKSIIALSLVATLALPGLSEAAKTTNTRTYKSTTIVPMVDDAELMEKQEEAFEDTSPNQEDIDQQRIDQERIEQERIEQERMNQQRMEQERLEQMHLDEGALEQERMEEDLIDEAEGAIDYNDRTRTDRARKALNTSSDASDDQ